MAEPQRQTFRDANGREVGRSVSDGRNTTFYDAMGRNTGRSVTNGNTTTVYDQHGSSDRNDQREQDDGHALVGVNTGHEVDTLISRSRLGARWRGRPREGTNLLPDLRGSWAGRIPWLRGPLAPPLGRADSYFLRGSSSGLT